MTDAAKPDDLADDLTRTIVFIASAEDATPEQLAASRVASRAFMATLDARFLVRPELPDGGPIREMALEQMLARARETAEEQASVLRGIHEELDLRNSEAAAAKADLARARAERGAPGASRTADSDGMFALRDKDGVYILVSGPNAPARWRGTFVQATAKSKQFEASGFIVDVVPSPDATPPAAEPAAPRAPETPKRRSRKDRVKHFEETQRALVRASAALTEDASDATIAFALFETSQAMYALAKADMAGGGGGGELVSKYLRAIMEGSGPAAEKVDATKDAEVEGAPPVAPRKSLRPGITPSEAAAPADEGRVWGVYRGARPGIAISRPPGWLLDSHGRVQMWTDAVAHAIAAGLADGMPMYTFEAQRHDRWLIDEANEKGS